MPQGFLTTRSIRAQWQVYIVFEDFTLSSVSTYSNGLLNGRTFALRSCTDGLVAVQLSVALSMCKARNQAAFTARGPRVTLPLVSGTCTANVGSSSGSRHDQMWGRFVSLRLSDLPPAQSHLRSNLHRVFAGSETDSRSLPRVGILTRGLAASCILPANRLSS